MNDTGLRDDDKLASGGTLKGWHLAVIALLALGAFALAYQWYLSHRGADVEVDTGGVTVVPEGSRTVTLFFADDEEPVLFEQSRQVAIGTRFEEQVGQVVRALIAGPTGKGASAIPEGTQLRAVFYDSDTFTAYLDFSSELVAGHPGGSTAEYYTVSAIMRTLSENFPEVQAVQLLIEGSQVGTIAGHINAYDPFLVRDWR
jgi:spore germination protein GerM